MSELTINSLKSFVPFQVLNDFRLAFLLNYCSPFYARKGQVLLEPGKIQDDAYFLMSGRVKTLQEGVEINPSSPYALNLFCDRQEVFIALSDCSFFKVNKKMLDHFVCWSEAARYLEDSVASQRQYDNQLEWIKTLLSSNLFYKLSPLNLEKIFIHLTPVPVKKGEVIISQGDRGESCFFIKEGQGVVTRQAEGGESIQLAEIGVGHCFGEDALLHEAVRNATVTMLSDGLLMQMEKRDFLQLLKAPDVDTLSYADLEMSLETGSLLIDVRTPEEYQHDHLEEAISMPLGSLCLQSRLLDRYGCYVVYCDTDLRSRAAAYFLSQRGFRVRALQGGLNHLPIEEEFALS